MNAAFAPDAAGRLLAELMPIAITVAGHGAAGFAQALANHGADVEILTAQTQPGFDLGILLADRASPGPETPLLIEALAAASERLLFVPAAGSAPQTDAWFEALAEHGYQPVVDYDASFLGQGAFLVDRNAVAAEGELAAFSERLSGIASSEPPAPLPAGGEPARAAAEAAFAESRAALTKAQAELKARDEALTEAQLRTSTLLARLDQAEAENHHLRLENADRERLRNWVLATTARSSLNRLTALRAATGAPRGNRWRRLLRLPDQPTAEEKRILADLATLRDCPLFDAAWYIAANPGVAQSGIDPVLHYLLTGAATGAEPGPYFDTAAYRARHPGVVGNPLLHAIASGAVPRLIAEAEGS